MEAEERPSKLRKLSHKAVEQGPASTAAHENGHLNTENEAVEGKRYGKSEDDAPHGRTSGNGEETIPPPDEMAPVATSTAPDLRANPLSKNQQKKLRKKAEWEAKREDRKVLRKIKNNERKERKRDVQRQLIAEGKPVPEPKQYVRARQLPVTFLIDCDFDDLMREGEMISLGSQITRCYSDNKNAKFRAHLTLCSFAGKLRERFDTVLDSNYKSWRGVREFKDKFTDVAEKSKEWMSAKEGGSLTGVFSKYADLDAEAEQKLRDEGEVVYLSSEADEDLHELKPYSTYIIGGLVDKNREKGLCHKRATRAGVKTAKLPIGKYMDMQSRKVLATNHVNEIMLKWLECGDWGEAFLQVIPKRKGGTIRTDKDAKNGGIESSQADQVAEESDDGANSEAGREPPTED